MTDQFGLPEQWNTEVSTLEPVQLEVVRVCKFKPKPCGICGLPKSNRVHTPKKHATCPFQRKNGCAACGKNKGDHDHYGAPESFNVFASGQGSGNAMIYARAKEKFQEILTLELIASGLPRGLGRVYAEGEVTFPEESENRDQGNFRMIPEKALGDALVAGGWLVRDNWARYEFGGLTERVQAGESATRIVLLPSWPVPPSQGSLV